MWALNPMALSLLQEGTNFGQVSGVSSWTNITQVACGQFVTVGLKSDGTVVAAGDNTLGQCDVASWTNIIQVAAWGNLS